MIVPDYWAEARLQHREGRRQVTVRRFGWSTQNEADARAMAESRAGEALQRILAGERLSRRERKAAYNGAFGVPIREEVLARHGEEVVTRNSYGAHCLNTPRALFADIDFDEGHGPSARFVMLALLTGAALFAAQFFPGREWVISALVIVPLLMYLASAWLNRLREQQLGGPEAVARTRVLDFVARHPAWNVRVYRTPGGLRLLATHQPFTPEAAEVQQFFTAVRADPVYVRMCLNQHCFRARLTGKPWRIGIAERMHARAAVWPIAPEKRPERERWVAQYEKRAANFAACHFVESLGSGAIHATLASVVRLHDSECRASTQLPIA